MFLRDVGSGRSNRMRGRGGVGGFQRIFLIVKDSPKAFTGMNEVEIAVLGLVYRLS